MRYILFQTVELSFNPLPTSIHVQAHMQEYHNHIIKYLLLFYSILLS